MKEREHLALALYDVKRFRQIKPENSIQLLELLNDGNPISAAYELSAPDKVVPPSITARQCWFGAGRIYAIAGLQKLDYGNCWVTEIWLWELLGYRNSIMEELQLAETFHFRSSNKSVEEVTM
ncbi:hypothetical protein LOAG_13877 [Loa loa]|uniref:Uncharacterized protein n=1 Tax=Loa loa TaxID=7209 RepID=A0A1S0TIN3_LOALO|nr:hypothetical protein LOAG_13877 [Loa loa]EFO14640.1 hypothetical protein LOAG_13877 [Loa loa]